MHYYNSTIYIPHTDKKDTCVGKVERWQAHKLGTLHQAVTVCLLYNGDIILQHRKHPVFDGYYDLTCSSHPVYEKNEPESVIESAYATLLREWGYKKTDIKSLKDAGFVVYRAKDKGSDFIEHETCHLVVGATKTPPSLHREYAYGFSLVNKRNLMNPLFPLSGALAPWVKKLFKLLSQ